MRYLAWIAVFSLQLGMFVCGAGIDVCQASDAPELASGQSLSLSIGPDHELSPLSSSQTGNHSNTPVDTCAAHAAHVFLGQPVFHQAQPDAGIELVTLLASLNLPEIIHLIEQPPKLLHS